MVVVGGGHAGCEAALASARTGAKTLLLTLNLDRIAWQVRMFIKHPSHVRDVLQLLPGVIVSSRPFRPVAAMLRQGSLYLQPCNPAVGGPAKSQLVHEVDALGGEMGRMADLTYLQKRVLNRSKVTAAQLAAD